MASFLNGLAQMGAGLADFAGKAGLEQQRSDLAQQQLVLANQLAMTRDSAQNTFTSGENEKTRVATRENLLTSESGAYDRAKLAADTSTANTKLTTDTSVKTTEMTTKAAGERNDADIKAQADRLLMQQKAGNEVSIDGKTGYAVLVNKADGSVKPLLDSNGDPLQLPDNEGTKAATTLLNTTNEELRTVNQQRAQDIRAAQDDLDKAASRPDLFGADKDAEINKRRQALNDIRKQYDIQIQALQNRLSATAAKLLNLRPGRSGGASGDRPPLGDILTTPNAAPTNATNSGLLHGGGQ